MGESALEAEIVRMIEQMKQQFVGYVRLFCEEHGQPDVKIANVTFRYGDWQASHLMLNCAVSLDGVPEKQQVPILRQLEAAWQPSAAPIPNTWRHATYHPTSKYKERRLQLEQSVSIRL